LTTGTLGEFGKPHSDDLGLPGDRVRPGHSRSRERTRPAAVGAEDDTRVEDLEDLEERAKVTGARRDEEGIHHPPPASTPVSSSAPSARKPTSIPA
jgi:hypothetical protein